MPQPGNKASITTEKPQLLPITDYENASGKEADLWVIKP
jgi:hypothetical protein